MEGKTIRVLMVDDDEGDYLLICEWLAEAEGAGFDLEWVSTYDQGLEAMRRNWHDVYLVDYMLGAENGLELLREVMRSGCKVPTIVLTGQGNPEVEKEATESGAVDYLEKGEVDGPLLARCICRAIKQWNQVKRLQDKE